MGKEFVITNTGTRKTFKSLKEVIEYIEKSNVRPFDGGNTILVDEITIKSHAIALAPDDISLDTFHKLIDKLLDKLSDKTEFHCTEMGTFSLIGQTLRALNDLKIQEVTDHFHKGLEKLDIDPVKFDLIYNHRPYPDKLWNEVYTSVTKSEDKYSYTSHVDLLRSTCILLLEIIKSSNTIPEKFKVVRLRTNYKPCNAFGISSQHFSIGIRPGDVVAGSSLFTGRKVSVRGEEALTEASLSKLLSGKW